jgi:hypothetical protein
MPKIRISGLLLVGASLIATSATSATGAPRKREQADGDKLVCQIVDETGSRLKAKRICLTADQWRQSRQETKQGLEAAQRIRGGPDIE